jgi:hypothetical protein
MNLRGGMISEEHGHQTLFSLHQDAVKDHREVSREAAAVHKLIYDVPKVVWEEKIEMCFECLRRRSNYKSKSGRKREKPCLGK